jgi:GDP-L-fucose synthase
VWGSGKSRREFLYVEDAADALLYFMQTYDANQLDQCVNIGSGEDVSIKDLAILIKELIGFDGKALYDPSKPEGVKQKLLDVTKAMQLGWRARTNLQDGLKKTIQWYLSKNG